MVVVVVVVVAVVVVAAIIVDKPSTQAYPFPFLVE